ncbi:HK97 family phage prohead protease [Streptomyces sp. IBSNAI002]|uniref:HK97 family phage prohead protease n=1 Tax=Streptomyces sp. IBSNAI002 TaxID=3457500 RepID=UPI003FD14F99
MGTVQAVARDLVRSAPFRAEAAPDGEADDGRTLAGYAAVFGESTEIDSWEGSFTETIRKGAFRKTIRESTPVMQFDHGRHPLIGSIPIGAITDLREDDHGLYVEGRISDNWLMQPIRDAIAEKTVNGMSFRFEVIREEWRDAAGKLVPPELVGELLWMPGDRGPLQREIIEVKCRELGPVVFPAYGGTEVSVRARGMADELAHDGHATRKIRQSLARDAAAPAVPEDPELRREVATSLLFGRPGQLQRGAHLVVDISDDLDPDRTAAAVLDSLRHIQGAPLTTEHPPAPSTTDAPPADGHPSSSPASERLRAQISEVRGRMAQTLALIDAKDA